MQGVAVLSVVIAYELVRRYSIGRQQREVGRQLARWTAGRSAAGGVSDPEAPRRAAGHRDAPPAARGRLASPRARLFVLIGIVLVVFSLVRVADRRRPS